ncbi:PAS domain-containing protein [Tenacibaculum finnmarkense]|uniref:PAS domain-containing protein n=1 Tax=Tenacibaculum finnmarkense TaxID=2781243 RepID=UPI001EFBF07C|nr:PAS domain-containing protein [Tenacibaculum finnmarkense]MCG8761169.1 PAS domain-containing protein [Tenacibaculum finnmarkense]MCG8786242.1 PAS domain-containing protein [Tenacibaculum finnmarkense]MCG8786543.1 PAS domain-containing protein [Tenacibaculum finnmarkense]MCG8808183.1 PAS domain-containing protein [Tenacibaculum finnmarkense]MCG8813805.1 PAS domain-containing protein [Tenacibaculum finnmarkense]
MTKNPLRPQQILDEEIKWDKTQTIISKTDAAGTILYMNDAFETASEYNKIELIGEPHNIIRHPDMPKIVFKVLWENLKGKKNFHAIVKNLTRTGRYYWVITDFTIDKDEKGNVVGYTGRRKALPNSVVEKIAPLYKTLLEIEKVKGEAASKLYFDAYLKEEIGKNYDEFVVDLFTDESMKNEKVAAEEAAKPKKGLSWFFSKN